jgi:hypothetical protein
MRRLVPLFLLFVLPCVLVGCDPIVMIPGGQLSGEVASAPDDWRFTNATDTFQLETRPADPYSVNVWAVAVEDSIYVAAGSGMETTWAQHIASDDRVRLRIGETIYELRASEDSAEETRNAFLAAVKKKYDYDSDDEDENKALLFRLDPR